MHTAYINLLKKRNDISYYTYPFPTGRLYIFGDKEAIRLVQFGYNIDHKKDIEKKFKASVTDEIEKAVLFLDNYLIGKEAELPELDLSSFSDKEQSVYNQLKKIPFGNTVSYKELSELAGIQNGARFVGNTMARNIFPVLIPCHRVINSNGTAGNFSAGREVKKYLLQHEKAIISGRSIPNS
ncbi:MAG: methylated-DNA--[protein]-cysteine S-methyltransferase [Spirochaetes bacterium]|nr:methylated-DNA--[protein]-cysteine S-methyltransferase [Spirochaetota bacterium]